MMENKSFDKGVHPNQVIPIWGEKSPIFYKSLLDLFHCTQFGVAYGDFSWSAMMDSKKGNAMGCKAGMLSMIRLVSALWIPSIVRKTLCTCCICDADNDSDCVDQHCNARAKSLIAASS